MALHGIGLCVAQLRPLDRWRWRQMTHLYRSSYLAGRKHFIFFAKLLGPFKPKVKEKRLRHVRDVTDSQEAQN